MYVRFRLFVLAAFIFPVLSCTSGGKGSNPEILDDIDIVFTPKSPVVLGDGEKTTISYTVTGGSSSTIVRVSAQSGWKASLRELSAVSGKIDVEAPDPVNDAVLLVSVEDRGRKINKSIDFAAETIRIVDDHFTVGSKGITLKIKATVSGDYRVVLSDSSKSWIKYSLPSKSLREDEITLIVAPNVSLEARRGAVIVKSVGGHSSRTIVIDQDAASSGGVFKDCSVPGVYEVSGGSITAVVTQNDGSYDQVVCGTNAGSRVFRLADLDHSRMLSVTLLSGGWVRDPSSML